MKKLYFLLFIAALATSSCDDFLNTEPIDKIAVEQYYTNEEGLTQALAGVYDPLGSEALYGNAVFTTLGACTDEGYYARPAITSGTQVYDFQATASDVNDFWKNLYRGINNSNELIAHINLPQMDESKRQAILGEALFLRAYYHFLLVSNFGDIPLKLTPTTTPNDVQTPKTPAKDVYVQILKDMTEAEAKVNTSTSFGYSSRVSKTVVQGILARVCLQMAGYPLNDTSKYTEALSWAKKVQNSGEHALNTTFNATLNTTTAPAFTNNAYSQIFINEIQDIYDVKEGMWEVDFKGVRSEGYNESGRLGNTNGITMTGTFFPSIGYSSGFIRGTARLYKMYKTGDLRRDWVLTPFTYNGTTGAKTLIPVTAANPLGYGRDSAKWRRSFELNTPRNKNYNATNFPILRYADVMLMLGETENQVNGPTSIAYDALNQVRRRGFGLPIGTASVLADLPAGLSKADFQQAVEDERMRELCFEGTRRPDLIRWGKFVSTMNAVGAEIAAGGGTANAYGALGGNNVKSKHLLYPIPSSEMNSNKALTQNTGW
jgi:hypothetical protein